MGVRAQTEVIQADYDRQIKVIRAQGLANYTVLTKEAQARAQKNTINMETSVLGGLMETLHLDGAGLVTYQQNSMLDDMPETSIFFGFGDTAPTAPDQRLHAQNAGAVGSSMAAVVEPLDTVISRHQNTPAVTITMTTT